MTKTPKRLLTLAAAAAALLLAGCDRRPPDGSVAVREAWVRLAPVRGRPGAAYFRMKAGSEGARLTGVYSPLARRIELHESVMEGAMAHMRGRKDMEFPSRGELVFEPGGRHAMLFGLDTRLKPGDTVPLTFSFNVAPPVTVQAEVRDAAGRKHEGH
jgi:copper(I)-binding protein